MEIVMPIVHGVVVILLWCAFLKLSTEKFQISNIISDILNLTKLYIEVSKYDNMILSLEFVHDIDFWMDL